MRNAYICSYQVDSWRRIEIKRYLANVFGFFEKPSMTFRDVTVLPQGQNVLRADYAPRCALALAACGFSLLHSGNAMIAICEM
ncbi:hypothetical protein [Comamonas aquatica]|uniref:hypothetical protein n=1 Tax=Comamonas aquatica TaxID=225991 RepID=UPI0012E09AF1|nr:hypothetical protein [Comamonas aquatica]